MLAPHHPPPPTVKGNTVQEYVIDIAGLPHTVLLDEDEAKRVGAKRVEVNAAPVPANKARSAQVKNGAK